MKLNIALCDDDKDALPIIAGAVRSTFHAKGVATELKLFSSGESLLEEMKNTEFNLFLLDIDMGELDGITLARRIRAQSYAHEIIFVSECENRVFESFSVHPLGFVRKSNFLNDIRAVVELYMDIYNRSQDTNRVEFETRVGTKNIEVNDILYFEGSRNYQLLYLANGTGPFEVKQTMERLEEILNSYGFIRIHKGYLVNHTYIQRIKATQVLLMNGTSLPIGRSKQGDVKARYISLLNNE